MRFALTLLLFSLCSCATVEPEYAHFYGIDSVTGHTLHQMCRIKVDGEWLCFGISEPDGTQLIKGNP